MERSWHILIVCFVVLLGCFVQISTVAGHIQDNAEIKEAWAEAYRGHKKPEQVYECLKRVQQVYASSNTSDLSYNDQKRKRLYDILYEAWNPTPDQCDQDDFTGRDRYFERYFLVERNFEDYWQHCEQKRIQVCVPVLEEQLRVEIDEIGEAKRLQAKLLVDSVKSECAPPKQWYEIKSGKDRDKVLTAGVLKYMETMEGPLNKSVFKLRGDSQDRFTGVYKRLVGDLCFAVFDAGRKQMEIFKVIKRYNPSWQPTGLVEEWMEADRICQDVFIPSCAKTTFELLRDTNKRKGLFGLGQ